MNTQEIDFVKLITDTINSLCNNMFSSIDNSIYPILDKITFLGPDNLFTNSMEKFIGTSASSGILVLANAILVRFYFILLYPNNVCLLSGYSSPTLTVHIFLEQLFLE